jgi:hypothetical protein
MLHMGMKMSTLPRVYTNSQNRIRLHKIGRKDRNFPISTSDFVQADPILAVRVNGGLSCHRCLISSGVEQHSNRH